MSHSQEFSFEAAFSRTIGWVTPDELATLRRKKIAIAGLGGVGGSHLLALARLGIGAFHIADFDVFELHNFNRQAGARVSSLGQAKADVLNSMARDINPELYIKIFSEGVTEENINEFLDGVDLFVDGLDFFAFSARELVFGECHRRGIPALTSAPLGMSVAHLNFLPGGMSFEEYFGFQNQTDEEKAIRFLLGLAPRILQRTYLQVPSAVNFKERRGPSTPMACELCTAVMATEVLKVILKRGKVLPAPHGFQFDAYRGKFVRTWLPWGARNPIQILKRVYARWVLNS